MEFYAKAAVMYLVWLVSNCPLEHREQDNAFQTIKLRRFVRLGAKLCFARLFCVIS